MVVGPDWWVSGKSGSLSPKAQAQVWALNQMSEKFKLTLTWDQIAAQVTKVGGGHPAGNSVRRLCVAMDADPNWYPGKLSEGAGARGPKRKFTEQKQQAIAKCARALKASGDEPTVDAVRVRCPTATTNPETEEPFDKKLILNVFRTRCYDKDPNKPWKFQYPLQKTSLSDALIQARLTWATAMLALGYTASWYNRHCVWFDPCYTILPGSARAQHDAKQSRYGRGKRWISDDAKLYSRNLQPSRYASKQKSSGDRRIWWMIIVCRNKVRLHFLGEDWAPDAEHHASFVLGLPRILNSMLGADTIKPRTLFTDRGPGMYQGKYGTITEGYRKAVRKAGFTTFAGDDASWQPGDVADALMHETVASWCKKFFAKHPLKEWSIDANKARLHDCAVYINKTGDYDVTGLTSSMPRRMHELKFKYKGGRMPY